MMSRSHTLVIAIVMLLLIIMGAAAMHLNGLALKQIVPNFAAWAIGAAGCCGLRKIKITPRRDQIAVVALTLALAATFIGAGQSGVHRWLYAGPITINVAAIVLPSFIVLLARLALNWATAMSALIPTILIAQPDASQASGFAAACIALFLTRHPASGLAAAVLGSLVIVGTWMRSDPLQGVPEVEGIVALGFEAAPALGFAMLFGLIIFCCLPIWLARLKGDSAAGLLLSLYLAGISAASIFGEFPVPFIGLGMSFPIGLWLAIGLLRPNVENDRI